MKDAGSATYRENVRSTILSRMQHAQAYKQYSSYPEDTKFVTESGDIITRSQAISGLKDTFPQQGVSTFSREHIAFQRDIQKAQADLRRQDKDLDRWYKSLDHPHLTKIKISDDTVDVIGPKPSEVLADYHGKDRWDRYAAMHVKDWGLPAAISGISWLAGDKDSFSRLHEAYAAELLVSTKKYGETSGDYLKRRFISWDAAKDIYLPVATVGAGYIAKPYLAGTKALDSTRIGQYIHRSVGGTKTAKVITSAGTSAKMVTINYPTLTKVGITSAVVAPSAYKAYKSPEYAPLILGRTAAGYGKMAAGFYTGGKIWTATHHKDIIPTQWYGTRMEQDILQRHLDYSYYKSHYSSYESIAGKRFITSIAPTKAQTLPVTTYTVGRMGVRGLSDFYMTTVKGTPGEAFGVSTKLQVDAGKGKPIDINIDMSRMAYKQFYTKPTSMKFGGHPGRLISYTKPVKAVYSDHLGFSKFTKIKTDSIWGGGVHTKFIQPSDTMHFISTSPGRIGYHTSLLGETATSYFSKIAGTKITTLQSTGGKTYQQVTTGSKYYTGPHNVLKHKDVTVHYSPQMTMGAGFRSVPIQKPSTFTGGGSSMFDTVASPWGKVQPLPGAYKTVQPMQGRFGSAYDWMRDSFYDTTSISGYWKGVAPTVSSVGSGMFDYKTRSVNILLPSMISVTKPMMIGSVGLDSKTDTLSMHKTLTSTASVSMAASLSKSMQSSAQAQKSVLSTVQNTIDNMMSPSMVKKPSIYYKQPHLKQPFPSKPTASLYKPPPPFMFYKEPSESDSEYDYKKLLARFKKGYRERTWKVPTMKDFLGV